MGNLTSTPVPDFSGVNAAYLLTAKELIETDRDLSMYYLRIGDRLCDFILSLDQLMIQQISKITIPLCVFELNHLNRNHIINRIRGNDRLSEHYATSNAPSFSGVNTAYIMAAKILLEEDSAVGQYYLNLGVDAAEFILALDPLSIASVTQIRSPLCTFRINNIVLMKLSTALSDGNHELMNDVSKQVLVQNVA